jgi:PHD/YefM family antitoxin component YafN of YafNO toxin-antitoxin module
MRTISERELMRRGLSVIDEMIDDGPVHVLRDDRPMYAVMPVACYDLMVEAQREAETAGVREALADVSDGQVRRITARQLIEESGLNLDS